ncbi:hypothetical protein [Mesorhizobium sp.]|uniref:hypothetical protein n=1 Tax=Mesorhizobium sp. TaxID=1871066 RepID=UPI000FE7F1B4|nr:hypothetical protein [Mesorhizobium sp.]RWG08287.1 MAG: hypothetical protein EOQ54_00995 [Mesorhizobium sp.]TIN39498.1 MAG: hypothetical protein E5Y25_20440 [Mesorhizobium sp.]TIR89029.1 MAG: hypothetical protein E5X08_29265 [Mesorhizobium sp.]TIS02078.1 MAG: hypothetical protein E5X13_11805 [Mesorhizobium sp.]
MEDEKLIYFEKRLQNELEAIEERIRELEKEKSALLRQIAKARADRQGLQFVSRRNSQNRVLAENSVLMLLREKAKPLSTSELYRNARFTNYDLKEGTFRTYLHRMKSRGLILMAGHVGMWKLPDATKSPV